MRSLPILSIGAALGASIMRMRPLGFGLARVRSSKYKPHQGAKERERAKRCHYSHWLNEQVATFHPRDGHLRVSPTLCQMSKRQYEAHFGKAP